MTIAVGSSSQERARRRAYLRTLRDLRASVVRNRPMSLPNLLRLYQRCAPDLPATEQNLAEGIDRLKGLYLRHQPFTEGTSTVIAFG